MRRGLRARRRRLGEVALVDATSRIGQSGRTYFHTLYDDAGELRYAGKVGTGFDDKLLVALRRRLEKLELVLLVG